MRSESALKDLTCTAPLRELAVGLLNVCAAARQGVHPSAIQQLYQSASICLEANYRVDSQLPDRPMTVDDYARLIDRVAGGDLGQRTAVAIEAGVVRLVNTDCPLNKRCVQPIPGLCRTTSDLLGDIAARNFGYAKVAVNKQDQGSAPLCELSVCLDRDVAGNFDGVEYSSSAVFRVPLEEVLASGVCHAPSGRGLKTHPPLPTLVAYSTAMKRLLAAIDTVAPTPATVLVTGETGVGKELVARRLHDLSDRAGEDFIAVNCGSIPEDLVDSALFGHEKGAFTGAYQRRAGYFERARQGTLFLDEIDALTPSIQRRLLRVLQEGEYERVGGDHVLHTDARVVAATNKSLCEAVTRGEFRKDLWFRINVVNLHIPPLRASPEAIPQLVEHVLEKLRLRYGKPVFAVSPRVMQQLRAYHWPGNVRELENVLERGYVFAEGAVLDNIEVNAENQMENEFADVREPSAERWQEYKRQLIERAEMRYLERSLRRYRGDVSAIANDMRLTSRSIYLKLSKYRLELERYRT